MSENSITIKKKLFTTKELVLTAMLAAVIAVCAWISIPATVEFTLQVFGVFCALEILGGRNGFFDLAKMALALLIANRVKKYAKI